MIERAEFPRPIVVPPDGSTTIRIAAVAAEDGTVDAVVRSAETGFAADHFKARLRFGEGVPRPGSPEPAAGDPPRVGLDPAADLYGTVLFQGGRFQRLRGYRRAAARHVDADVATAPAADASTGSESGWFAGFLPGRLLLGDPGMRDALMHGNQVCVPDATLLPTGIERLHPIADRVSGPGELRYCATERRRDGDTYVYDIAVRDPAGQVVERWDGLHLQAVRRSGGRGPWVPALLGPYLERAVEEVLGVPAAVAVEPHPAGAAGGRDARRAMTALAAGRALGRPVDVRYRPDGRPEVHGERSVSASHGPGLTLCVAAHGTVSCDVEPVAGRPPADWDGLLGSHRALADLLARDLGEDADTAATRVWAAAECLQKAGAPADAPLAASAPADGTPRDGWAVLASGDLRVATFTTTLRDVPVPVVFAVLTGEGRS